MNKNVILKTNDNVRIEAVHYESGFKSVIILAHGFFNAKDAYLFRKMAEAFAAYYDVVSFDFRGHGKSSGLFTWTSKESADLATVIGYVRNYGYESIGLIGFSLGAAISLIKTARNSDVKTVIAVSAPYDFWKIDYHFWEPGMWDDLMLNLGYKGKGKGIRPGNPFDAKIRPIDIVADISPIPVFFIHGADDWLIKPHHSEKLFNAAWEPKRIEIVPSAGHAEKIFDKYPKKFLDICVEWLNDTLEKQEG